ncbi:MAG: radical SAM protein, partial [Planctomycetaceae bacterium]|nr:radical SAM protein [Planctomycetaceae bacterium]
MDWRENGAILLVSCYELGHQPYGVAHPSGFLSRAGYSPAALDIAVESWDVAAVQAARFIGISVPMHTALRLGLKVIQRIREVNPHGIVCCYGLYASLNATYLLSQGADYCVGGESEAPLLELVRTLEAEKSTFAVT